VANKHPSKSRNGKAAETPAEGMYFLSLTLENARCFGAKQTLDLSNGKGQPARWTILLGNNGTGKTTVLQALALPTLPIRHCNDLADTLIRSDQSAMYAVADCSFPGRFDDSNRAAHLDGSVFHWGITKTSHRVEATGRIDALVCFGYGAARRLGAASLNQPVDVPELGSLCAAPLG
jgi:hypothetical protein